VDRARDDRKLLAVAQGDVTIGRVSGTNPGRRAQRCQSTQLTSHQEIGTKSGTKKFLTWDQMAEIVAIEDKIGKKISGRGDRI
jgi:hypothetical protein